jgi:hypothetical protein
MPLVAVTSMSPDPIAGVHDTMSIENRSGV